MTNVARYMKIVEQIVIDIETDDLLEMPCFVNTMGFVEGNVAKLDNIIRTKIVRNTLIKYIFNLGSGLNILYNVISITKPSDVIQLKFNENQDLNLYSEIINDNTKSNLSYNLWYFISMVKNKSAKAPYLL